MFLNINCQCLIVIFLVQISFLYGDDIFNMFATVKDQAPTKIQDKLPETTIHHVRNRQALLIID